VLLGKSSPVKFIPRKYAAVTFFYRGPSTFQSFREFLSFL